VDQCKRFRVYDHRDGKDGEISDICDHKGYYNEIQEIFGATYDDGNGGVNDSRNIPSWILHLTTDKVDLSVNLYLEVELHYPILM
jgi:hypothetical protein